MNDSNRDSSLPVVRLISFGAGSAGLEQALIRLRAQAEEIGLIDEVKTYSEKDLDVGYKNLFGDLPETNTKGFGLWSWKPYLVLREAKTMKEGDILFYLDAGVEINVKGKARFCDYLDHIAREEFLFFSNGNQQRFWSRNTPELLTSRNFFRNQLVAGIFGIRISKASLLFLEDWLALSAENSGELLKDAAAGEVPIPGFVEHRHDQSTFTAVAFSHNVQGIIPDETWFQPWRRGHLMPLLALRNKTGKSYLSVEMARPGISLLLRIIRVILDSAHRGLVIETLSQTLANKFFQKKLEK